MYDVLNQQIHPLMEQPSCRLKVRTVAQRLERAWRLTLPFRILYYHTLALALDPTETLNPNPYLYVLPTPTPAPTLRSNPNPNPSPDPDPNPNPNQVYWRSFWSACGDMMRFQWRETEQASDVPTSPKKRRSRGEAG